MGERSIKWQVEHDVILAKDLSQQQSPSPPPSETKKSKYHRNLWALILILIVVGTVVVIWSAWWSQPTGGYTQIRVVQGDHPYLDFGGTVYYFWYNPLFLNPQTLRVSVGGWGVFGSDISPITQGNHYEVLGLEIVASEVHSDYVVLLVKQL